MKKWIIFFIVLLTIIPALADQKAKTGADPTDFITRIEPS